MKSDGIPTSGRGMVKTLQKYGNSYALIIDRALLDTMGIAPDTELRLTIQGDSFTVRPANVGIGREKVDEIMGRVEKDYGRALKKLSE